ncbi:VIT-4 protein [Aphelenchoides avenae]|nr:VIT-4 protein [Aphelenchus avenae]
MEYHEKMCFSTRPVKKCPLGTEPDSTNEKSVPFKCYQRGSMNAQRMLKKARNGDLLDELHDEEPSFSHSVKVPRTCVEAY